MRSGGTLRRVGAGVLAAAVFGLAACAGDSGGDEERTTVADRRDRHLRRSLRFTTAGPSRNLDPALQTSYGGWGYLVLIYDRLTMLDKDDNVQPGLATEWSFAEDGIVPGDEAARRRELPRRDEVQRRGGQGEHRTRQDLGESAVKNDLADIESVEVVDDYTVRFHLVEGRGVQLPSTFTTNVGMMVSPEAIDDPSVTWPTTRAPPAPARTSSPSYVPTESMTVERAPSYWDPGGRPARRIEIERVPDGSTRLRGVQTGQTDLTTVSAANDLLQAQQIAERGEAAGDRGDLPEHPRHLPARQPGRPDQARGPAGDRPRGRPGGDQRPLLAAAVRRTGSSTRRPTGRRSPTTSTRTSTTRQARSLVRAASAARRSR